MSRQPISKWESGNIIPDIVKLISLSDMFGVTVDYLVRDELENMEKEEPAPDTERLEQRLNVLSGVYH